ncbi:MAG: D-2-hydroxyacid dehydrogenase [Chloroflexi bacterium]|nr:D-2-hydroxyacid dehydrogenase [Chloroflexota bacterium]
MSRRLAEKFRAQIEKVALGQLRLVPIRSGDPSDPDVTNAEIAINGDFDGPKPFREIAATMPRLKWIHSASAGLNDIASRDLVERGVWVTNSAGVYAPSMVEYVLAMLVIAERNLPGWLAAQRERRWLPWTAFPDGELYRKRMGIIGYGATGRYLAQAARALGMEVWACRRTPALIGTEPLDRLLTAFEIPTLLEACDYVVVAASLNSTTRGLISTDELRRMKPGAILVNIARGKIVDEAALISALRDGRLRAAILDVTSVEPLPADSPLWDMPNVFITPHISGNTRGGYQRTVDLFCANLRLYLAGQPERMGNLVDLRSHL